MPLLKEQISNHPTFSDVERTLILHGFLVNEPHKEIEFYYTIEHQKNGVDVSEHFNPKTPRWAITNAYQVVQRGADFQPMQNPDWKEGDPENQKYLTAPAFDYFVKMVFENDVNLKAVLRKYIQLDDQKNAFD